eukprot:4636288-Prymnesium_polylepis.1
MARREPFPAVRRAWAGASCSSQQRIMCGLLCPWRCQMNVRKSGLAQCAGSRPLVGQTVGRTTRSLYCVGGYRAAACRWTSDPSRKSCSSSSGRRGQMRICATCHI